MVNASDASTACMFPSKFKDAPKLAICGAGPESWRNLRLLSQTVQHLQGVQQLAAAMVQWLTQARSNKHFIMRHVLPCSVLSWC